MTRHGLISLCSIVVALWGMAPLDPMAPATMANISTTAECRYFTGNSTAHGRLCRPANSGLRLPSAVPKDAQNRFPHSA